MRARITAVFGILAGLAASGSAYAQPAAPVPYNNPAPVPYTDPNAKPFAAPSPSANGVGSDTIFLKGRGVLRGTIIDAVPNSHARIQLATGEVVTVQWSEVQSIAYGNQPAPSTPGADASKPAVSQVMVHIESPADVDLQVRLPGARDFHNVCTSPCDQAFDTNADYRINGSGVRPSAPFRLTGKPGERVVLSVDPNSSSGFVLGIVGTSVGAAAFLISLFVAGILSSTNNDSSTAWVVTAVSGAITVAGIVGIATNGRSKVIQDTQRPLAHAPLPMWREAKREVVERPMLTVPLFSASF